ncbi:MAG TPA: DUF2130 domain-containing protein, partial [Smithella sp.]|nr:DUF2130 domain-containing protein [Smithella sp.]
TRKEFEKRLSQKDADIVKRESTVREKEEALSKAKEAIDEQVAEKVKLERAQIISEEAKKARLAVASDLEQKSAELKNLNDVLNQQSEKLAEAQKAQVELIRKQRELDDAKRDEQID